MSVNKVMTLIDHNHYRRKKENLSLDKSDKSIKFDKSYSTFRREQASTEL